MSLRVNGLTKSFGDKIAVNNVSFSMEKPGVFGLIGTNGAGKTTTIRSVLGIMTPDSGSAEWNGKRITRETLSFGYMPEERGIYMKTKVLEQLIYFGMLRGMTKADAKKSALSYLDRLGIMEYKDVPAEKLSKGNQQKVQLISTLIHDPVLIFLDEPFSGLDPVNAVMLSNLIKELVENKRYIVMSSHQMNTVEDYCENILLLHNGRTVLQGNLKEIKKGYGHTNLVISADERVLPIAEKNGLVLLAKQPETYEFKITGDAMAEAFLKDVVAAGIMPTKYVVKEPSLNEIFIEKVGEEQ
ncbi:MAG TPA: ATP-binding cassette domain-containing protein [Bacillota bacterium]|nr:ATP-binding cassette domain-containing protein [Bacillota bacterium]HOK68897.1 ATP-binding cassette domain-containing protein [Bacillota bacterium]HPP84702.1 ATP-binding cassette domain-containing protein [Bacillota bacterium]